MKIDRADVAAALTAETLSLRYGMNLRFRGRWARTRTCPWGDHATPHLAVSRDGRFRCFAHCVGGDLIQLAGAFEGLEHASDLPRLLTLLAEVAGVTPGDDFGGGAPAPRPRPPAPQVEELGGRIARATERAAWLWGRLAPLAGGGEITPRAVAYVAQRGLDPAELARSGEVRQGPAAIREAEAIEIAGPRYDGAPNLAPIWTIYRQWVEDGLGVALPCRHVETGAVVDVRLRRVLSARDDSPKIIGMLGGVTSHDGELVACYGHPHDPPTTPTSAVIVVEGAFDYLTTAIAGRALEHGAWVLGAVDAGQYPKVAAHAAAWCAETGAALVLVAQEDGPGGAAVRAVDAASVEAIHLGVTPRWIECGAIGGKDLSAIWQRSPDVVRRAIAEAARAA
jgi:hypothetical protein